jgi:hypothetical protein
MKLIDLCNEPIMKLNKLKNNEPIISLVWVQLIDLAVIQIHYQIWSKITSLVWDIGWQEIKGQLNSKIMEQVNETK